MYEWFTNLFSPEFMPHGHCFLWTPSILWPSVISDLIIAFSYFFIAGALTTLVVRRKDLTFKPLFFLFAVFIFACGTTHLMDVWTVWHGSYRSASILKMLTAFASLLTAVLLGPVMPKLLTLKSPAELEALNKTLISEANQRKEVESRLRLANDELESRIQRATLDLQLTLAQKDQFLLREKQARADSEKASRLKDEFLATVSHELRTPLNALAGWIQVLLDEEQNGKRSDRNGSAESKTVKSEAIPILRRNVAKLSGIIDDLLDMSVILTGSVSLSVRLYDIVEIAREVIQNLAVAAQSKRLEIVLDPAENVPPLRGDVPRIRQIIWHLLSNAIKFTPEAKKVIVRIEFNSAIVNLSVIDEGRGIDPVFLPHVFQYFRQESASAAREFSGLGIGLSIAKQLAELHGGSIRVESRGIGEGAKFTLSLPRPT